MIITLDNHNFTFALDTYGARIVKFIDKLNQLEILQSAKENYHIDADKCGGFPLLPLANRIKNNSYTLNNQNIQLIKNSQDHSEYLHGIGYIKEWTIDKHTQDSINLSLLSENECGYGYHFKAHINFKLCKHKLTIKLKIEHLAQEARLYGLGFHPYFKILKQGEERLLINARGYCAPNQENFFLHPPQNDIPHHFDFNCFKGINLAFANYCYTDCHGLILQRKIGKLEQNITLQSTMPYLMLYHTQEHNFIALESQSHLVDGVNLPNSGIVKLTPYFPTLEHTITLKVDNSN